MADGHHGALGQRTEGLPQPAGPNQRSWTQDREITRPLGLCSQVNSRGRRRGEVSPCKGQELRTQVASQPLSEPGHPHGERRPPAEKAVVRT